MALLPTEIDHMGNIFRRAGSGRGWGGFLAWPLSISSHLMPTLRSMVWDCSQVRCTVKARSRVAGECSLASGEMNYKSCLRGWGVLPGQMQARKTVCVAGEYSSASYSHLATNILFLPTQPIMHGWGVLSGRTHRPTTKRYMAGEYSSAYSFVPMIHCLPTQPVVYD